MNVVDSSAWIAFFRDELNAGVFAEPIQDTEKLLVPTITLTEVFKYMHRHFGGTAAMLSIARMNQGRVADLDNLTAVDAALCALELQLPLADSIIYATARRYDAIVWTQDADFKDLPGVRYYP